MRTVRNLVLAALMLVALAGVGQASAGDRPGTSAVDGPDPFFGVISQRAMTADDFEQMKWGRMGSYRAVVQWAAIEGEGDGNMNWEELDRVVGETARRGISLLPTLYHTPGWLHKNWRHLPVSNSWEIYKWKQFLEKAVDRYGSRGTYWLDHPDVPYQPVRVWQIWNEPNIVYFARPVGVRKYAKLLRISAAAIRGRDPHARIAIGGLYGKPPPGKGTPAGEFMKRLYKVRGARRSFDVVAVHPYATTPRETIRRTWMVRRPMIRNGDRKKKLLITEIGWGSDSGHGFGLGTADGQGDQLRSAYRLFLSNRRKLNLGAVYWFSWSDLPPGTPSCSFCLETGLFDYLGNPKPTWERIIGFTHGI